MTGAVTPGLTSVTFRRIDVDQVVEIASAAGLRVIEWAGDVHVPPGDLAAARLARKATERAGLAVASYGSYYRAGDDPADAFADVLRTAVALGAPRVRVWAGGSGSAGADSQRRARVSRDLRRVAELADPRGVKICVEFHAGTLTDTLDSAVDLFSAAGEDVQPYWQSRAGLNPDQASVEVGALLPQLAAVHVFHWVGRDRRRPLAEGSDLWKPVLAALRGTPGTRQALLEFVRDDDPAALAEDAATLRGWLAAPVPP